MITPLLSAHQAKELDRITIEEFDISGSMLMETAGLRCSEEILRQFKLATRFLVLVGPGNNGGDGLVIARWLVHAGKHVHVQIVPPPSALQDEARTNFQRLHILKAKEYPISIGYGPTWPDSVAPECIVDALLGIGTNRAPEGALAEAIDRANASGLFIFSIDVPSGLDASTGEVHRPCIKASCTLQIGCHKLGLYHGHAQQVCGTIVTIPIGFPEKALPDTRDFLVEHALSKPLHSTSRQHKYHNGVLYLIGGSTSYPGAIIMAATAAWRRGIGALNIIVPSGIASIVQGALPQSVVISVPDETFFSMKSLDVVVAQVTQKPGLVLLGPGLGRMEQTSTFITTFLEHTTHSIVIDADALWHLAQRHWVKKQERFCLITPHPGEARALNVAFEIEQASRLEEIRALASQMNVTVVAKGNPTFYVDETTSSFTLDYSTEAFSRFGFGDALAGQLAADLLQHGCNTDTVLRSMCDGYNNIKPLLAHQLIPDPFQS